MALSVLVIRQLADRLYEAEAKAQPIPPITDEYPDITPEEAYRVQLGIMDKKLQMGRKIAGKKIGLTSKPMQQMMGVTEPDYGHILDDMVYSDMEQIEISTMNQPKVEAELAFILADGSERSRCDRGRCVGGN